MKEDNSLFLLFFLHLIKGHFRRKEGEGALRNYFSDSCCLLYLPPFEGVVTGASKKKTYEFFFFIS
jgi:hypothetical protein